jgi:hypothetical protein
MLGHSYHYLINATARMRANELNYKFVWVRGGRVYLRKNESSDSVFVKNMDTLKNLS